MMSYIRSTSNPEKLYIWGDEKLVNIYQGPNNLGRVPVSIFNGLLDKYRKNYHNHPCEHKGAKIDEILIDGEFKMKFAYENIEVVMWDVTWEYIVNTNIK